MYVVRFDFRSPGADKQSRAGIYRTALDMARWVDERDCASIIVSEHHVTDDGYLPSPLPAAAAIAAVTERTQIIVAVAVLPFYDPVRLAEDLITLDHLSQGRVLTVLGLGYRPVEYRLHGVDFAERGRIADEKLEMLLDLLRAADSPDPLMSGPEATPRVTPAPFSNPARLVAWGGRSRAAARRAGRFGLGFFAQTDAPGLREAYLDSAEKHRRKPAFCFLPSPAAPFAVFVNDDVDQGWNDVGRALLNDASGYQDWNETTEDLASFSAATTIDTLRSENGAHRVTTVAGARDLISEFGILSLHPLCGGLNPDLAWPYLERAVGVVTG